MWLQPRLVDLITAHLDTPLIPSGLGALSNTRQGKGLRESEEGTEKNTKIKLIKTDLESNGALGGECVSSD